MALDVIRLQVDLSVLNIRISILLSPPNVHTSTSPGCGHCKRLAPAYDQVGAEFAAVDSVVVAKVDADADRDLGSRFGVKGFPTLKFFPKGSTEPEE